MATLEYTKMELTLLRPAFIANTCIVCLKPSPRDGLRFVKQYHAEVLYCYTHIVTPTSPPCKMCRECQGRLETIKKKIDDLRVKLIENRATQKLKVSSDSLPIFQPNSREQLEEMSELASLQGFFTILPKLQAVPVEDESVPEIKPPPEVVKMSVNKLTELNLPQTMLLCTEQELKQLSNAAVIKGHLPIFPKDTLQTSTPGVSSLALTPINTTLSMLASTASSNLALTPINANSSVVGGLSNIPLTQQATVSAQANSAMANINTTAGGTNVKIVPLKTTVLPQSGQAEGKPGSILQSLFKLAPKAMQTVSGNNTDATLQTGSTGLSNSDTHSVPVSNCISNCNGRVVSSNIAKPLQSLLKPSLREQMRPLLDHDYIMKPENAPKTLSACMNSGQYTAASSLPESSQFTYQDHEEGEMSDLAETLIKAAQPRSPQWACHGMKDQDNDLAQVWCLPVTYQHKHNQNVAKPNDLTEALKKAAQPKKQASDSVIPPLFIIPEVTSAFGNSTDSIIRPEKAGTKPQGQPPMPPIDQFIMSTLMQERSTVSESSLIKQDAAGRRNTGFLLPKPPRVILPNTDMTMRDVSNTDKQKSCEKPIEDRSNTNPRQDPKANKENESMVANQDPGESSVQDLEEMSSEQREDLGHQVSSSMDHMYAGSKDKDNSGLLALMKQVELFGLHIKHKQVIKHTPMLTPRDRNTLANIVLSPNYTMHQLAAKLLETEPLGKALKLEVALKVRNNMESIRNKIHGDVSVLMSNNEGTTKFSWDAVLKDLHTYNEELFTIIVGAMVPHTAFNNENKIAALMPRIGMVYAIMAQTLNHQLSLVQRTMTKAMMKCIDEKTYKVSVKPLFKEFQKVGIIQSYSIINPGMMKSKEKMKAKDRVSEMYMSNVKDDAILIEVENGKVVQGKSSDIGSFIDVSEDSPAKKKKKISKDEKLKIKLEKLQAKMKTPTQCKHHHMKKTVKHVVTLSTRENEMIFKKNMSSPEDCQVTIVPIKNYKCVEMPEFGSSNSTHRNPKIPLKAEIVREENRTVDDFERVNENEEMPYVYIDLAAESSQDYDSTDVFHQVSAPAAADISMEEIQYVTLDPRDMTMTELPVNFLQ